MGRPPRSASAFPGNLDEWYLAGMRATGREPAIALTSFGAGTGCTTNHSTPARPARVAAARLLPRDRRRRRLRNVGPALDAGRLRRNRRGALLLPEPQVVEHQLTFHQLD